MGKIKTIKFGSVCSGIEAASVAWKPLGWEASWLAEIEPFPSAVLKHHYPDTPNHGDMTLLPEMVLNGDIDAPDVLVGGTPCQSFSVAGMRAGLSDERGQLTIKFVELADAIDNIRQRAGKAESITVWENVPGVLSSKDNAFGCFLGALAGEDCELKPAGKRWSNAGVVLGPKRAIAWRILDAQYFGLAQRRRRVFVVASARDGFCPAKVLFEFDGVRRDIAPSREAGQETTGNVGVSAKTASGGWPADVASTLNASFGSKLGLENQHINGGAPLFVPAEAYSFDSLGSNSMKSSNPYSGCRKVEVSKTLDTTIPCPSKNQGGIGVVALSFGVPGNWIGRKPENGGNSTQFMHEIAPAQTVTDRHGVVAFAQNTRDEVRYIGGDGQIAGALAANPGMKQTTYILANNCLNPDQPQCWRVYNPKGVAPSLQAGESRGNIIAFNNHHAVALSMAVRRLTPIECERLQGFPDNYTQIPWRNKPAEECPDGRRYKALGNSMAVPVMAWIGRRITGHLEKTIIT